MVKKDGANRLILTLPTSKTYEAFAMLPKGKDEGYLCVTLQKPGRKMTTGANSQGNCIHGWLAIIAQDTGNEVEDLKTYFKLKAVSRGYPVKYIMFEPYPKSLTEVTTEEAGHLIDTIAQWASENGYRLPSREDFNDE